MANGKSPLEFWAGTKDVPRTEVEKLVQNIEALEYVDHVDRWILTLAHNWLEADDKEKEVVMASDPKGKVTAVGSVVNTLEREMDKARVLQRDREHGGDVEAAAFYEKRRLVLAEALRHVKGAFGA